MKPSSSLLFLGLAILQSLFANGQENEIQITENAQNDFGRYDALVPQYLLGLVHAPEVHVELSLTSDQINQLEALFADIDAVWFPARNQPLEKQRVIIASLESRVRNWFVENASEEQRKRLDQLEFYAQSGRMLLRDDVAKRIGLQASQQKALAELADATDGSRRKLAMTRFGDSSIEELRTSVANAMQAERDALTKVVRAPQREALSRLLGKPFDPSQLKRIYAMAPEFVDVKDWINSTPLTMRNLRGKVVLIHFYAFQCHNCHANFEIYRRWHRELTERGVVVIGIQTPETSRERKYEAVRNAAVERGLDFPIVVDVEKENWLAWGNTMWPTVYVVDQNGYIRHWWQGELNWKGATADKTIEQVVDRLLTES